MALFPYLQGIVNDTTPDWMSGASSSAGLGSAIGGAAIGQGLLGSSLIGGASGLAGGIVSGIFGSLQAKKQREFQREMLQKQMTYNSQQAQISRDWQEEMWNKNNEYNSASAQRARLEEAGLNPNMMMQGGSAGTAQSAGSSPTPSAGLPSGVMYDPTQSVSMAVGSLGDMATKLYQRSMQAEQVKGMRIDNMTRGLENTVRIRNMLEDIGLKNANKVAQELSNKLFGEVYDEQVWQWQLDNDIRFAQLATIRLDADTKKILNKYLEPQQQAGLMLTCAQVYNAYASGQLTYVQMDTEIEKQLLLSAQAAGQRLQNDVLKETKDELIKTLNKEYQFRQGYLSVVPDSGELPKLTGSPVNFHGSKKAGAYQRAFEYYDTWRKPTTTGWNVGINAFGFGLNGGRTQTSYGY